MFMEEKNLAIGKGYQSGRARFRTVIKTSAVLPLSGAQQMLTKELTLLHQTAAKSKALVSFSF